MQKSKSAIFTVQHDEDFFLPLWLKYYLKNFEPEDIYIVAHNCTEITEGILQDAISKGVNVENVRTEEIFNHDWLNSVVHAKQRQLLGKYEYVVFADCDEFIVPETGTLKNFISSAQAPVYRCVGYSPINGKMFREPVMDKTLITTFPLTYSHGYHTASLHIDPSPDLYMFHLHRVDYDEAFTRSQRLATEKWDNFAVQHRLSFHNKINDEKEFNEWFHNIAVDPNNGSPVLEEFSPQLVKLLRLIYPKALDE